MRKVLALAMVSLLLPGAAVAENLNFSPRAVNDCLEGGGWRDCIGTAAQACMEDTEGGYSTPGMAACLDAERAWWDGLLNTAYGELRERARTIDAEEPIPGMAPRPSDETALRDMQRAWIAWRDASCTFEAQQWWGGTGASGVYVGCLMRLTGEQALHLRSLLAEG